MSNGTHLNEKNWIKKRIQFIQKELEDLKQIKKTEESSEEGLKDGRRRWYNIEMEEKKKEIEQLNNQLEKVEN